MKKIIIHSQDLIRVIDQSEILFCKSDNCYTTIFLSDNEEHVICKSLSKTFKELDTAVFIRVNQSYVININFIKSIDKKKKTIELIGSRVIPFTTTLTDLLSLIASKAAMLIPFILFLAVQSDTLFADYASYYY